MTLSESEQNENAILSLAAVTDLAKIIKLTLELGTLVFRKRNTLVQTRLVHDCVRETIA